MASGRSTNSAEEFIAQALDSISKGKAAVDGMQWLPQLVKIETGIIAALNEGRNQQMQQQMQQQGQNAPGQGPPPMGGAPMGGPGGPGGGMPPGLGPSSMGPAGMPGQPGPGIAGLRRSTPGAPDELRRILNAGPG